jgi:hypothetical protein
VGQTGDYIFFYVKANEIHQLLAGIFIHHRIISRVKKVEFVGYRESYM